MHKAEVIGILANVVFLGVGGYLLYLVIMALRKYINHKDQNTRLM